MCLFIHLSIQDHIEFYMKNFYLRSLPLSYLLSLQTSRSDLRVHPFICLSVRLSIRDNLSGAFLITPCLGKFKILEQLKLYWGLLQNELNFVHTYLARLIS